MDSKKIIIVDLDGTLANVTHRLHFVRQEHKKFDDFHAAAPNDTPHDWCVALMEAMHNLGHPVYIVSARPKRLNGITLEWLQTHKVVYDALFLLREDKDHRPDHEMKKDFIARVGLENILFVVDDRRRVVDMWRAEGLICLQCADWPEYKKPMK